jgi:hypothetical protein
MVSSKRSIVSVIVIAITLVIIVLLLTDFLVINFIKSGTVPPP